MRVFKTLVMTLFLMGMAPTAQAASEWYHCVVDSAGTGDHNLMLFQFTDQAAGPAFVGKWFVAPENLKIEYLALALKAISRNRPVTVRIDLDGSDFPTIERMFVER